MQKIDEVVQGRVFYCNLSTSGKKDDQYELKKIYVVLKQSLQLGEEEKEKKDKWK